MLDLPGYPILDKNRLLGGCVRLPLSVDPARLALEVANLPAGLRGTTGGRVGVHRVAEAVFLRGYAPAEGEKPIEDRAAIEHLPYVRWIIGELVPADAQRCLLARLPPGAHVAPHIDQAPYFAKTLRIHIPVETHDQAWMYCAGLTYQMRQGEVWLLNNSTVHAVWNAHATQARTHLICDFLPSPTLLELLARGDRNLGIRHPQIERHLAGLAAAPRETVGRPGGGPGTSARG
jgi:hypothetical protein